MAGPVSNTRISSGRTTEEWPHRNSGSSTGKAGSSPPDDSGMAEAAPVRTRGEYRRILKVSFVSNWMQIWDPSRSSATSTGTPSNPRPNRSAPLSVSPI